MTRIIALTETTDPTAVANQAVVYSKDMTGVTQLFVRLSDGTIVQLSGVSGTASPIVVWTAAKTWSQVYTEITSFSSKCVVLIEPSGANRNITTGTYDINGVRFIGMPQLTAATVGYGAVKVVVDASVTFSQDGTTLFAVISSQDVFWYFDAAVQPVQQDKIRIRLDGGKMHADSGSVFTNITEARVFLTGGAHLQGYSNSSDALIQLADGATCVIESYAGRVMQDIVNTPGTAFSATVTLWTDSASVVYTSGSGGWFRSANTTPTYVGFWGSSATPGGSANALAMVASDGSFHKPSVDTSGNWSNIVDPLTLGTITANTLLHAAGALTVQAELRLNAQSQVASPGAGPVDDYALGYTGAVSILQNTDSGGTTINSIATIGGNTNIFMLMNSGPTGTLTLKHETGTTTTYRFGLKGSADRVLAVGEGVWVYRDTFANRWRLIG